MAISTQVTLGHRLEDSAIGLYFAALRGMKLERASAIGAGIVQRVAPLVSAHGVALRNLRLAYPDESESWRRDVARANLAEIGRTAGEFPHMADFAKPENADRIEIKGETVLAAAAESGAVFIGGHFSNWEIMALAIVRSGAICHVTYRPANNPLIDKRIIDIRRAYGVRMQSAKGREGGMGLLRALARHETIALMNDQKYNEGVAAPLFGHDCMTADGPSRLALRFGLPLVPVSIRRLENVRFQVTFHPPIALDRAAPPDEAAIDGVHQVNAFMEARIREAPEQWFWVHRRWPKEAWQAAGV